MPQTKHKGKEPRKSMTLPKPIITEVDRIIKKYPMYGNRQQLVESAIREKIEKVRLTEAGLRVNVERIEPQPFPENLDRILRKIEEHLSMKARAT